MPSLTGILAEAAPLLPIWGLLFLLGVLSWSPRSEEGAEDEGFLW